MDTLVLIIIVQIINFIITLTISKIEILIDDYIIQYSILLLVDIICEIPYKYLLSKYDTEEKNKYMSLMYKKYDELDPKSKEKDTISNFTCILSRSATSFAHKKSWVLNSMIRLITSFISFIFLMFINNHYMLLFIMILCNIFWYYIITKNIFTKMENQRTNKRKTITVFYSIIRLLQIRFHNGDCNYTSIINKENEINKINNKSSLDNDILYIIQRLPNILIFILIPFLAIKNQFTSLLILFKNVGNTLDNFSFYINRYQSIENDINGIEEFWKNKTFRQKITQIQIPPNLKFFEGSISNGLIQINKLFEINKGDRIRIEGESGSGKTTFIKSLFGNEDGLKYDNNEIPESFIDNIAYMKQDIRENTPVVQTTIRELFNDDTDNELIIRCIKISSLEKWFSKEDGINYNIDKIIEGKISGGEKTRLCLAITLYYMIKRKAQWLILDEPEQGIDPNLAPEMLSNVFNEFPDLTIFIITHMCDCKMHTLNINKKWTIKDNFLVNKYH
jgi:ABC-type transport system involved in cytochrome bd biosynthesis fused ATPase/permease subunit